MLQPWCNHKNRSTAVEIRDSALPVRGLWAMFAQVMMLGDVFRNSRLCGAEQYAAKGEARDVLEDVSVLNGLGRSLAPGEGCVAGDENARNRDGIKLLLLEQARDDGAGVANVGFCDFFG